MREQNKIKLGVKHGFFRNQYHEYIRIDMIVKEYRVDFKKPLKASYLQRF